MARVINIGFFFLLVCLLGCFIKVPGPGIAWGETGSSLPTLKEKTTCTITIQGNTFLSSDLLLAAAEEELEAYRSEGFRQSDVDDAAFQMEYAYRLVGFVNVSVVYFIEKHQPDNCDVLFKIQEGSQQLIHTISLSGNNAFDGNLLLLLEKRETYSLGEQKNPIPFVEEKITSLVKNIRNYYLSEGYLDVIVQSQKAQRDNTTSALDIHIAVDEGKQYTIGTVSFSGETMPEFIKTFENLKKGFSGQKFQHRHRLLLRTKLEELYKNNGYADVIVRHSEQKDTDEATVHLKAHILSGKQIIIHDITLSGLKRTKENFVLKRLKFHAGETYSLAKIRESSSALYETGLFQSVNIDLEEQSEAHRRNIQVTIEEKRNRELYIEPGWGSYELLRLGAGYRDWNLLGSGHRYRLNSVFSSKGRSIEMALTEPWLLGTDIDMDIPIYYRYRQEPSFTTESNGFAVYFSKNFPDKVQLTAGYQNDRNNTTDVNQTDNSKSTIDSYTTTIVTMQMVRDTRDDYFFPSKGYRGFVAADVASSLMGGNLSFYRLKAGARVFRSTGKSSVLGMRYTAGIILPFGEQKGIPEGERFYNGGENSVRSFKESKLGPHNKANQPIGGAAYNVINLEWRHKFTESIAASIFFDAGNISPNKSILLDSGKETSLESLIDATLQDFFRDMKIGIGAGLQYLLPVGPARLDFAFNPNAQNEKNESSYVVHFSIGMAF